jgi:hypothetical protein
MREETFNQELDGERIEGLLDRVRGLMLDAQWRTFEEIKAVTGGSEAGISARLRDLRKPDFGRFVVNKRRRGDPKRGLWEYQVLPPKQDYSPEEAQLSGNSGELEKPRESRIKPYVDNGGQIHFALGQ